MAHYLNTILALLTIGGQILIVLLILSILSKNKNQLTALVTKHAILFSFVIALSAMLGSLTYSEIIGYDPCKLCWIQRIFIYPLVFMLGIAYWKKHSMIRIYAMTFSAIAGIIALYQYLLQIGFVKTTACDVVGYSVSCSQRFTMNFGYITIPMMALTTCALIFTFFYVQKKSE